MLHIYITSECMFWIDYIDEITTTLDLRDNYKKWDILLKNTFFPERKITNIEIEIV